MFTSRAPLPSRDNAVFSVSDIFCGYDDPLPADYQFGPLLRDVFLIQYCTRGKGIFTLNGRPFPIHAGQAFFSFPNSVMIEHSSADDPWGLMWIAFKSPNGPELFEKIGVSEQYPVFSDQLSSVVYSHLSSIITTPHTMDAFDLTQTGQFYLLFGELLYTATAASEASKNLSRRIPQR